VRFLHQEEAIRRGSKQANCVYKNYTGLTNKCYQFLSRLQSKERLVRTTGAIRVHAYRAKHIQLDEILTHIEGRVLSMVLKSSPALRSKPRDAVRAIRTGQRTTSPTGFDKNLSFFRGTFSV